MEQFLAIAATGLVTGVVGTLLGYMLLVPVMKEQVRALTERVAKLENTSDEQEKQCEANREACRLQREGSLNELFGLARQALSAVGELKAYLRAKGVYSGNGTEQAR